MLNPLRRFYLPVPWHVVNGFCKLFFAEANNLLSSEEVEIIESIEVKEEVFFSLGVNL